MPRKAQRLPGEIRVRPREGNGRHLRVVDPQAVEVGSPTAVRRLRDAALRGMVSPEWGTELGYLFLVSSIDAAQYVAGKKWVRLVARYHEAIGAEVVSMAGNRFERVDPANDLDPASKEGERRLKSARQAIKDMLAAAGALRHAGSDAERAVVACCEAGRVPLGWPGTVRLRHGLEALVVLWALRKGR